MHFTFIKEKVFVGNMTSVESTIVSKCFQHFVIVLNYPTSRTEKYELKKYRSFSLSRNKKNKSKTIKWIKSRNCDLIGCK